MNNKLNGNLFKKHILLFFKPIIIINIFYSKRNDKWTTKKKTRENIADKVSVGNSDRNQYNLTDLEGFTDNNIVYDCNIFFLFIILPRNIFFYS